jgi:hypothetical protein
MATNGGRAARTKTTIKGARKGAQGGKKGQKRRPHRIAVVTSNGGSNEEAGDSGEESLAATEHDFRRQKQPPKDYF